MIRHSSIRASVIVCSVAAVLAVGVTLGAQAKPSPTAPAAQAKPAPAAPAPAQTAKPAPAAPTGASVWPQAGPVVVMDTAKGVIEFETYPSEAPKTVEYMLNLIKRGFYNGQRFHRVVPGFVIQVGDPSSRDMTKQSMWGSGGSGKPVGVAEISPKLIHRRGIVAMAHAGDPAKADAQFYILTSPTRASLDGKYAIFGRVTVGMDVVDKIAVGDVIKKMAVK